MERAPRTWYGTATTLLLVSLFVRLYLFGCVAIFSHGEPLMRSLLFLSLGLACTLPRLYLDITSSIPYPLSYDSVGAVNYAVIYTWMDAILGSRPRLATYMVLAFAGPDTRTINGLEYMTVSILAWDMNMPLATAYFLCTAIEFFLLQPIKTCYTNAIQTDIPRQMRASWVRGAMIYASLCFIRLWIPYYSYMAIVGGTMIAVVWILVIQWINLFHYDRQLNDCAMLTNESGELVYRPLRTKDSFRLIRILPSVQHEVILRCELHEVSSLETAPNTYITVSYRWDTSLGKSSKIILNGAETMVYPKVERILRDLQASFWSKIVWIDQVCINQADPMEKSNQVAMMSGIYGTCNQLRVCLPLPGVNLYGPWENLREIERDPVSVDIEAAIDMLWRLSRSRMIQDYSPRGNNNVINPRELFSFAPLECWQALAKLLDDPWFQRIWVVQEVGLAREIFIHYGHMFIEWDVLVRAMAALARSNLRRFPEILGTMADFGKQKEVAAIDNVLIMENMRDPSKRLHLLETMILCQRFQATERVDKVYALLGILAEDDYLMALDVDYSSSLADALTNAARLLLAKDLRPQDFRVLRFAGKGHSDIPDLPSWVPDWSIRMTSSSLAHRRSEMDFAASPRKEYSAGGALHTFKGKKYPVPMYKGYIVDRIKSMSDLSELPETETKATPFLDALVVSGQAQRPYITQQSHEEAFWRTIIADTHPTERPAPPTYWRHWQSIFTRSDQLRSMHRNSEEEIEYKNLCRTLEYSSSPDLVFTHLIATDLSKDRRERPSATNFDAVLNRPLDYSSEHDPRASQGRQFCVTEKGYMGLVPKYTSQGDYVVILHGATTPHVFRGPMKRYCEDCERDLIGYHLVGEAYVHGSMYNAVQDLEAYTEEEFGLF